MIPYKKSKPFNLLMLFLLALAYAERLEPYTLACKQLAAANEWPPCEDLSGTTLQQCLCDIPEYNEMTTSCLEMVAPDSKLLICHQPSVTSLSIGLEAWKHSQIDDTVKLVVAQLSIDATAINRARADHYSNGLFIYWLAVMLIFAGLNMWLWLLPQQYACTSNLKAIKYIRQRIQFGAHLGIPNSDLLILVGSLVLNFCFLFCHIPLLDGHVSLPSDHEQRLKHIADRAAYCGAKMMPLVVFLGGRNSFLMTLTGWDIKRYNVFHKWTGRILLLNFIIHGCCYASIKVISNTLGQAMKTSTFQFGTASLVVLALIIIQSLKYIRRNFYELFVVVHVTLWLGLFALGICHVRAMAWGQQVFWASIGLWIIDRGFRILRIAVNGSFKKALVTVHDNKVVEVAVHLEGREDHCGTFAFVQFINLEWWQSHPFSYFCDGDYMRFMITPREGITSTVNQLAQYRTPQVLIDGPYGTRPNFEMFDTVVFIVGGIGVTAVVGHIRALLRKDPKKHVHLHWAVKGAAYLEFVDYLLQMLPGNLMVSVYMSTTKKLSSVESINNSVSSFGVKSYQSELLYCLVKSRLNVPEIVSSHIHEGSKHGSMAVVVCGPPSMAEEANQAIHDSIMSCDQYIEMYNQNFGW